MRGNAAPEQMTAILSQTLDFVSGGVGIIDDQGRNIFLNYPRRTYRAGTSRKIRRSGGTMSPGPFRPVGSKPWSNRRYHQPKDQRGLGREDRQTRSGSNPAVVQR